MGSQVAGVGGEEVLGEAGHVRAHDDEIGANLMRLAPQPLVEVDGRIGAGDGMGAKLDTMLGALRGREPGQLVREFLRVARDRPGRSEEHTSELQSPMRISYAVF